MPTGLFFGSMRSDLKKRICIATTEVLGCDSWSRISSRAYHAARILVDAGFDVTVLLPTALVHGPPLTHWIEPFRREGISIENVYAPPANPLWQSYETFRYITTRRYDLLIVLDGRGLAYWSIQARRARTALGETPIIALVADPISLAFEAEGLFVDGPETTVQSYMEQEVARWADKVVAAHPHQVDHLVGKRTDGVAAVLPALLHKSALTDPLPVASAADGGPTLLVAAPLDGRSGFETVCAAIVLAARDKQLPSDTRVVLLGESALLPNNEPTLFHAWSLLRPTGLTIQFQSAIRAPRRSRSCWRRHLVFCSWAADRT